MTMAEFTLDHSSLDVCVPLSRRVFGMLDRPRKSFSLRGECRVSPLSILARLDPICYIASDSLPLRPECVVAVRRGA